MPSAGPGKYKRPPKDPQDQSGGGASRTQHGSVGASLRRRSPEVLELLSQTAWSSEVYKNAKQLKHVQLVARL